MAKLFYTAEAVWSVSTTWDKAEKGVQNFRQIFKFKSMSNLPPKRARQPSPADAKVIENEANSPSTSQQTKKINPVPGCRGEM